MQSTSKKTSLIILAITALVLSRLLFVFFNDPEGPNLVVVVGSALVVYLISLLAFASRSSGGKKFLFAFLIQVLVLVASYFLLK